MSIIQDILKDLKVDLTEAYDRNFERKAFFSGAPWKPTKIPVRRGSLLVRSSAMRNSIKSDIRGESILFSSAKPYTAIHNKSGQAGRKLSATIPQRQFIGNAPEVEKIIKENIEGKLSDAINNLLNQQFKI
jgi:phage gpG-like protein